MVRRYDDPPSRSSKYRGPSPAPGARSILHAVSPVVGTLRAAAGRARAPLPARDAALPRRSSNDREAAASEHRHRAHGGRGRGLAPGQCPGLVPQRPGRRWGSRGGARRGFVAPVPQPSAGSARGGGRPWVLPCEIHKANTSCLRAGLAEAAPTVGAGLRGILGYGRTRWSRVSPFRHPRKVRAPAGRLPGNAWAPRGDGKGHREQTASGSRKASRGKGETVG